MCQVSNLDGDSTSQINSRLQLCTNNRQKSFPPLALVGGLPKRCFDTEGVGRDVVSENTQSDGVAPRDGKPPTLRNTISTPDFGCVYTIAI